MTTSSESSHAILRLSLLHCCYLQGKWQLQRMHPLYQFGSSEETWANANARSRELPTSGQVTQRGTQDCSIKMVTSPASGISLRWPSNHDTIDTHGKRQIYRRLQGKPRTNRLDPPSMCLPPPAAWLADILDIQKPPCDQP